MRNRGLVIVGIVVALLLTAVVALVLWLRPPFVAGILDPGPTPPPGAQVGEGGVFYQTNFQDPEAAADWEAFDDGFIIARVEGSQLLVTVDDAIDIGGWSGLGLTFDDFVLETEAALVEGRPADSQILIVFRLQDTENYNRFDVTFDGLYALTQVREGVPTLVSDFHAFAADAPPRTIRIEAVGDTFTFFVNGSGPLPLCVNPDPAVSPVWEDARSPGSACNGGDLVTSWQNADLLDGQIGLGVQAIVGFDDNFDPLPAEATVAYDSVVVRPAE